MKTDITFLFLLLRYLGYYKNTHEVVSSCDLRVTKKIIICCVQVVGTDLMSYLLCDGDRRRATITQIHDYFFQIPILLHSS